MTKLKNRSLSLILAVILFISAFSGISISVSAASYVYNNGTRGTVATELSSYAVGFYTSGNTYEDFAALQGSTNVSSVPSSALYNALQDFMADNHTHITSYAETKNLYKYTDCQNGGGYISSFYSGANIGPEWGTTPAWNREHTWPDSKGDGDAENDIMMLRPTKSTENSSRGNKAYGESSGYYYPNCETDTYDLRGDVARITLYVYVRWGNTSKMWGSSGVIESKEVLLSWMEADPVDTWELGRNDSVQSITGTRNVFVDYPELAFLMFGEDVPTDMTTPSGAGESGGISCTINAVSSDSSRGTVSVSGKTVNAYPASGYYVSGYSVSPAGSATVIQTGNKFYVTPAAGATNCTVTVNFSDKQTVSITHVEGSSTGTPKSHFAGDSYTLPSPTKAAPTGYTFAGWVTAPVAETTAAPTFYKAGASTVVNGATTFYALYTTVKGSSGGSAYKLVTDASQLVIGKSIIIAAADYDFAVSTNQKTNNREAAAITKSGDTITFGDDVAIFSLEAGTSSGTYAFATSGGYLGADSSSKNYLRTKATLDANCSFAISVGGGTAECISQGSFTRNDLSYNTDGLFSCYLSGTQKPVALYIESAAGATYYATLADGAPTVCQHANTSVIPETPATCTMPGASEALFCNDCKQYLTERTILNVIPHTYVNGTCSCGAKDPNYKPPTPDIPNPPTPDVPSVTPGKVTAEAVLADGVTAVFEAEAFLSTADSALVASGKDIHFVLTVAQKTDVVTPVADAYAYYTVLLEKIVDGLKTSESILSPITVSFTIPENVLNHDQDVERTFGAAYSGKAVADTNPAAEIYSIDTKDSGVYALTYTDTPLGCRHASTAEHEEVPATCDDKGYTKGVFCNDCGTYISGHEETKQLTHIFDKGVCTLCGDPDPDYVPPKGNVSGKVEGSSNIIASIPVNSLLTDGDKAAVDAGSDVSFVLNILETGLSESDKALVEAALSGSFGLGKSFDVSLEKTADGVSVKVSETGEKLSITFPIPNSMINADPLVTRTYCVVRIHNGIAEILYDTDSLDSTITVETDRFSTYTLAYTDKRDGENQPTEPVIPDEPENDIIMTVLLIASCVIVAGIVAVTVIVVVKKKRK